MTPAGDPSPETPASPEGGGRDLPGLIREATNDLNNWLGVISLSAEVLKVVTPPGGLPHACLDRIANACQQAAAVCRRMSNPPPTGEPPAGSITPRQP